MSGRNSHPDRDGKRSKPGRLDQFGETLASNDNPEAAEIASGVRVNSTTTNNKGTNSLE